MLWTSKYNFPDKYLFHIYIDIGDMRRKNAHLLNMAEGGDASNIRRRKPVSASDSVEQNDAPTMQEEVKGGSRLTLKTGSYWLTRIVLLRAIGFVYGTCINFIG